MIKYTKDQFARLRTEYLRHIGRQENPVLFVTGKMRRYGPVSQDVTEYVFRLLDDPTTRERVAELCIFIHYAETGKNILLEKNEGNFVGEPSETIASRLNDAIRKEAVEILAKERKENSKKTNRRIQQANIIRKTIRSLENEIKLLEDQITKKRKQIERQQKALENINLPDQPDDA